MAKFRLMQVVNKIISLSIVLLLIISCQKPVTYYHILNGKDKTIIDGKIKNKLENGEWSIATKEGKLLANGFFKNGLREGLWHYDTPDSLMSIKWKTYENKEKQIKLNLPDDWTIIENKDELFQATFNTPSTNKKNKYLLIGAYKASNINLSVKSYVDLSKQDLKSKSEIIDEQSFIVHNGEDQFYLSRYIIVRESEEIVVFNFIGLINNEIIDIGYSSLNEKREHKKLLFFEILTGCYYANKRILNPLERLYFEKI